MIERWLKNDISRKRWRRFKQSRLGVASTWLLLILMFFSFTAELWANSVPLILRYKGTTYYPIARYYSPALFGRQDIAQMDYQGLQQSADWSAEDWAVWPVIRWDPYERNDKVDSVPSAPTRVNLLGTDEGGRDVAARLLYGFRYSIAYALCVWFLSSIVGMVLGSVMGFFGGWTDMLGQRAIEILDSLPYLMILITLVSIFKPSLVLLSILTVFFNWVTVSFYFRAEFFKLRKREFIEAARALGASRARLIFSHILPNSLTPWITISPFMISGNIAGLAALDFLGFGLAAPTPSWGELLNQAFKNFRIAWWLAVYPSLALFVALVLFNLIGEAVRDALDPRRT